jgi:hypothetical protein
MGNSTNTDDIESFWEGLRPPRDPSTFTNIPVVDGVSLSDPIGLVSQPEDLLEPYLSNYSVDYGENSGIEVNEANVTFTTISPLPEGDILTDPPYSLHLSGTTRANISILREIVYTTERLSQLLNSAGISYNFTRLIDVIDARAQDLNIGPEDPRVSYFRETSTLLSNS